MREGRIEKLHAIGENEKLHAFVYGWKEGGRVERLPGTMSVVMMATIPLTHCTTSGPESGTRSCPSRRGSDGYESMAAAPKCA